MGNNASFCDLHCDALFSVKNGASLTKRRPKGHFDLVKMQEGNISCEVLSIFIHPSWIPQRYWWRNIEKMLVRLRQSVEAAPTQWQQAKSASEIIENREKNIRSLILEIEGLHPIADNPDKLQFLWENGVRIFTLTWNNSNKFAKSATEAKYGDTGLTEAGREIVQQIDKMGGIIDLSHASDRTFFDVLEMGISPILSHSCVREIRDNPRNATLEMIKSLSDAGGIIGINLFPGFLSKKRYSSVTSDDVVEHIEAIISATGENVPAIGSDFDGVGTLPTDIPDASAFGKIAETMKRRGFSQTTINKVMGENFLNYWHKKELL